jgi:hypothetical protein
MSQVEFDEDGVQGYGSSTQLRTQIKNKSGWLTKLVLKFELAKTEAEANRILLLLSSTCFLVAIAITIYTIVSFY